MDQATADLNALAAQQPSGLAETLRKELAMDQAAYAFRAAARQEELRVYELAGYASVENAVIPLLPPAYQSPISNTIAALHSLYILAGIDQYYLVNVHFVHPFADAQPVSALRSYYLEAQNRYGVDASYLAAINFIESNFGRINGPSSAGAMGPMQFDTRHVDRIWAGRERQWTRTIRSWPRPACWCTTARRTTCATRSFTTTTTSTTSTPWSPSLGPTAPIPDGSTACTTGTRTARSGSLE